MFAGDHAAPRENLREKFIERLLDFRADGWVVVIRSHDVDVNVAIAGMAESRDGKSVPRLQLARELDQINEPAARHDDVLVQFR